MSDTKLDAEQVADVLRTQPPPPGFDHFAVALGAVTQAPTSTFGIAMDPFKPADILKPPGNSFGVPPRCPTCHSLLQAISQNNAGDARFECLFDGYEAVYRVGSQVWEPFPRPGLTVQGWVPPRFGETPEQSRPGPTLRQPMVREEAPPAPPAERDPLREAGAQPAPVGEDDAAQWLTLRDAAEVTGLTAKEVHRLIVLKRAVRQTRRDPQGHLLVDLRVLEAHLAQQKEAAGG